jgi:hypothetical protein
MGKYLGPERRYVKRHHVNCVSVLYRRPLIFALITSAFSRSCDVSDLSWRGVRFYTKRKLRIGMTLDIVFDCIGDFGLGTSSPPIKARVIWQEKSESRKAWRTGVVFLELRDAERDAILQMIEGSVAYDQRFTAEFEGV